MNATTKRTPNATLAALRDMVKTCTRFRLHGYRDPRNDSYGNQWVFEFTGVKRGTEDTNAETLVRINVSGSINPGHTSTLEKREPNEDPAYAERFRPVKGFWSLSYRDEIVRSAVMALPVDVEPRFVVCLDAGTNLNAVRVGHHIDKLYFMGKRESARKNQEWSFILDVSAGPHNTARFGSPVTPGDTTGRSDW